MGNDWGCRSRARGATTIAISGLGIRLFRRSIGGVGDDVGAMSVAANIAVPFKDFFRRDVG